MRTDITQKKLKTLVSKDYLRPAMCGIYLDVEHERLVITDGHILVMYNDVQIEEDDISCIMPLEIFPTKVPKALPYCEYSFKDGLVTRKELGLIRGQEKLIDEEYPNYHSVIPDFSKPIVEIGLSVYVLKDLIEGIKDDTDLIRLKIIDKNKAIGFNYGEYTKGLIMPMMVNEEE